MADDMREYVDRRKLDNQHEGVEKRGRPRGRRCRPKVRDAQQQRVEAKCGARVSLLRRRGHLLELNRKFCPLASLVHDIDQGRRLVPPPSRLLLHREHVELRPLPERFEVLRVRSSRLALAGEVALSSPRSHALGRERALLAPKVVDIEPAEPAILLLVARASARCCAPRGKDSGKEAAWPCPRLGTRLCLRRLRLARRVSFLVGAPPAEGLRLPLSPRGRARLLLVARRRARTAVGRLPWRSANIVEKTQEGAGARRDLRAG